MAKYSKIKRVEPLQSHLTTVVEENQNLEEWEDTVEIEREIEKVKRSTEGRLDEDKALESKTTWDCRLCL